MADSSHGPSVLSAADALAVVRALNLVPPDALGLELQATPLPDGFFVSGPTPVPGLHGFDAPNARFFVAHDGSVCGIPTTCAPLTTSKSFCASPAATSGLPGAPHQRPPRQLSL